VPTALDSSTSSNTPFSQTPEYKNKKAYCRETGCYYFLQAGFLHSAIDTDSEFAVKKSAVNPKQNLARQLSIWFALGQMKQLTGLKRTQYGSSTVVHQSLE